MAIYIRTSQRYSIPVSEFPALTGKKPHTQNLMGILNQERVKKQGHYI